jgi:hypothetical protein
MGVILVVLEVIGVCYLQQENTGLLSVLVEHALKWITCLSKHRLNWVLCYTVCRSDSQENLITEYTALGILWFSNDIHICKSLRLPSVTEKKRTKNKIRRNWSEKLQIKST